MTYCCSWVSRESESPWMVGSHIGSNPWNGPGSGLSILLQSFRGLGRFGNGAWILLKVEETAAVPVHGTFHYNGTTVSLPGRRLELRTSRSSSEAGSAISSWEKSLWCSEDEVLVWLLDRFQNAIFIEVCLLILLDDQVPTHCLVNLLLKSPVLHGMMLPQGKDHKVF